MEINKITGDCTLDFGGDNYVLNFRTSAMIELETKTDMPIADFMEKLEDNQTRKFSDLQIIFFIFFFKHHGDLTKEQLINLMDLKPIDEIAEIVMSVINASTPMAKAVEDHAINPTKPAQRGKKKKA